MLRSLLAAAAAAVLIVIAALAAIQPGRSVSAASALAAASAPLFGVSQRDEWSDINARTLAQQAGVRWVRTSVQWGAHEPAQGVISLADMDATFREYERLGLIPVPFIYENPSWASTSVCGPINKVPLSAFADFARVLAERYDGDADYDGDGNPDGSAMPKVDYWQIYNEPDNQWLTGTASGYGGCWGSYGAQYAQLLRLTYDAVHTANADAQLIFGGIAAESVTCPPEWTGCAGQQIFNFKRNGGDFVDAVLSYMQANPGHRYFDLFDLHYYPAFHAVWDGPTYGTGMAAKVNYYAARLQAKGMSRPIVCTESGRRSDSPQVIDGIPGSDEEQSRYVVRLFTQAASLNLRFFMWFTMADFYDPGIQAYRAWGLLDRNHQPKQSYTAYTVLTGQLGAASYVRKLDVGGAEAYLFDVPGVGNRTVAWATGLGSITIHVPGSSVHTTGKWGEQQTISDGSAGDVDGALNGAVALNLGGSPLYIDGIPERIIDIAVNAGSANAYNDGSVTWQADRAYSAGAWGYVGGSTSATSGTIGSTTQQPLYRTDRFWPATMLPGYKFDVPNGRYEVTLKFAETYLSAANQRKFHVRLEGVRVLTDYDIFAAAGGKNIAAPDQVFVVDVLDGQLSIDFVQRVQNPKVNAIRVRALSGGAPPATATATATVSGPTATATSIPPTATPTATVSGPTATATAIPPTPTFTPTAVPGGYDVAVNVGGKNAYFDGAVTWQIEQAYSAGAWGYVGGSTSATSGTIGSTTQQPLYRTDRFWTATMLPGYKFDVPNGRYEVTLKFAETYLSAANQRKFHVRLEGVRVLTDYDIFAAAGGKNIAAPDQVFVVDVLDGQLSIDFVQRVQNPKVNAIRVRALSGGAVSPTGAPAETATPTPTSTATTIPSGYALFANTGGADYNDGVNVWQADREFVAGGWGYSGAGGVYTTNAAIAGTADQALYRSERNSITGYRFTVPNGQYVVTLGFSENYHQTAGSRRMRIYLEGQVWLDDFDVFAQAGGANRAIQRRPAAPITVSDNILNLRFEGISGQPMVNNISVIQQ